VTLELQA
jgi:hypothetical protein